SRTTSDHQPELSIDSPLAELIAAIEADHAKSEAAATAVPVAPAEPQVPHRVVQQTAQAPVQAQPQVQQQAQQQKQVQPQARAAQAQAQAKPAATSKRDLPLDPRLAKILGIGGKDSPKETAKPAAKPAPPQPGQRQQRV